MDSVNNEDEIQGNSLNPNSDDGGCVPGPIHSGEVEAKMPDLYVKDGTPTTDEDVQTPALSVFESSEIANSTTGPSSSPLITDPADVLVQVDTDDSPLNLPNSRANLQSNASPNAHDGKKILPLYPMPFAAVAMEEPADQTDYCDVRMSESFDSSDLPADVPDKSSAQSTRAPVQMQTQLTVSQSDTSIVSASSASSTKVPPEEEPFQQAYLQETSLIEATKAVRIVAEDDHEMKQGTEADKDYKRRYSHGGPKYWRTPENEALAQYIGLPDPGDLFQDENYIFSFDRSRRTLGWVCRYLKREHMEGDVKRMKGSTYFKDDPEVLDNFKIWKANYKGVIAFGGSKGHAVPSDDCRWDQDVLNRTFRMSQIFIQDEKLNNGLWNLLEEQCRKLAVAYGGVIVNTVPMYLPEKYERGVESKVVQGATFKPNEAGDGDEFWLIHRVHGGIHGPHVPTHVAMVLLVMRRDSDEEHGEPIAVGAYLFPNKPPNRSGLEGLRYYRVETSFVEKSCGFTFFGKIKETYEVEITKLGDVEKLDAWTSKSKD